MSIIDKAKIEEVRKAQAQMVMPMIGPLLDAWEGLPNDARDYAIECCPNLGTLFKKINKAMESAGNPSMVKR